MHFQLGGVDINVAWHVFILCCMAIAIITWVLCEIWGARPVRKPPKLYVVGKPVSDERDSISQFKRRTQ